MPVADVPPLTLPGLMLNELRTGEDGGGGLTVRAALCVVPKVAKIVAVVDPVTVPVVTVKVALV